MSAKTSSQPGRRTPLSLSGSVTKPHSNKGSGNASSGGGNNSNNHTNSNSNNKQDNKLQNQQQKSEQQTVNNSETKEIPNKKQQQQADKKQQQQNDNNKKSNEKTQNGVNNNKQQQQQANENSTKQTKDKQQQNGNDSKANEKDKKEKTDKLEKQQEKSEKEEIKVKEDKKPEQEKLENKKEDKKSKEVKETKEDKEEIIIEPPQQQQTSKADDKKTKEENQTKASEKKSKEENLSKVSDKKVKEDNQIKNNAADPKTEDKTENMEIAEEQTPQSQQKSPPVTPKTNSKSNKTTTPVNKTPTKASEKTPQKSTPTNTSEKTLTVTRREVTTAIDDDNDDIEMEPLAIESSPIRPSQTDGATHLNIAPSATSTPGKILFPKRSTALPKSDVELAMQAGISPDRPRAFSQISGRKSIRPTSDYTPSKFQMNTQFRESYRRINTELDATNTSMNVTVGSEAPNLSFSFFGRGRKRERTPPHSQSAIGELRTDMDISPPKRARLDMNGFFSVVSSPLTLLRNRFSKATLQSSTPVKLQQKLNEAEDEIEVQNVSGVSVHEDIAKTETSETNGSTNEVNDATLAEEAKENKLITDTEVSSEGKEYTDVSLKTCGIEQSCDQSDIKITETPLQPAVGDPMAKNKRCIVM